LPIDTVCPAFQPTPPSNGGLSTRAIIGVAAAAIGVCVILAFTLYWVHSKPAVLPVDNGSHEGPRRQWIADVAYDSIVRQRRIQRMASGENTYTAEETRMIAKCMALFDAFDSGSEKAKPMKPASTIEWARTKLDRKSGELLGRSDAIIRGASPEDLVAYTMEYDSRYATSRFDARVEVRSEILAIVNEHHIVIYNEYRATVIQNRSFINALVWKQLSAEPRVYVACGAPIDQHEQIGPADEAGRTRAESMRCHRFTALRPGVTLFENACWLDLKGHVPKWVAEKVAIPAQVHVPATYQEYFMQIRPIGLCAAEDGAVVAKMLMDRVAAVTKVEIPSVVSEFVTQTAMLRDCCFVHVGSMLLAIALTKLGTKQDVAGSIPRC
jgi:hypothetical protein